MTKKRSRADYVAIAMEAFITTLRTTWFDTEGFDVDGDEDGTVILSRIPHQNDPVLAERIIRLKEDFQAYVSHGHSDPNHPGRAGRYFLEEAREIKRYWETYPERRYPPPSSTVTH